MTALFKWVLGRGGGGGYIERMAPKIYLQKKFVSFDFFAPLKIKRALFFAPFAFFWREPFFSFLETFPFSLRFCTYLLKTKKRGPFFHAIVFVKRVIFFAPHPPLFFESALFFLKGALQRRPFFAPPSFYIDWRGGDGGNIFPISKGQAVWVF